MASKYRTFVISSIPILKLSAKNQARRFISLIDALYEARCRLVCLADAPLEQLFFPDAPPEAPESTGDVRGPPEDVDVMMAEAIGETQDVYRPNVSSYAACTSSTWPHLLVPPSPLHSTAGSGLVFVFYFTCM